MQRPVLTPRIRREQSHSESSRLGSAALTSDDLSEISREATAFSACANAYGADDGNHVATQQKAPCWKALSRGLSAAKMMASLEAESSAASTDAKLQNAADGVNMDAWSDQALTDADLLVLRAPCADADALATLQPEEGAHGYHICTLDEFVHCLQRMQGSIAEDMHVLCRGVAKHSVGATSAASFAELQHHLIELVQLSGPEVSCAWSTVKVGLGVASVLSGNPVVGGVMIAFAAGSLGTSLMWKVHRDRQKDLDPSEGKRYQTRFFSSGTSRCCIAAHRSSKPHHNVSGVSGVAASFEPGEGENKHVRPPQNATARGMAPMQCEVPSRVLVDTDAWSG